jgi:hypothetical protein
MIGLTTTWRPIKSSKHPEAIFSDWTRPIKAALALDACVSVRQR